MFSVDSDIETLISIYPDSTSKHDDEKSPTVVVTINLHNESEECYKVWRSTLTLEILINKECYPKAKSVKFHVTHCGGVEAYKLDEKLNSFILDGNSELSLFQIYADLQEFIEDNTHPFGICLICLEKVSTGATQLPCSHYFHTACIDNMKELNVPLLCPACRCRFMKNPITPKKDSRDNYYSMNDDIYDPMCSSLSKYFALIRNSGVKQSHHVILSYFNECCPVLCSFNEKEGGWVISFRNEHQLQKAINTFNGKAILPNFPCMEVTRYVPC
ncbi:hypothetical protein EIN_033950 [Entamoeba invadens IP1]|uniref:RING-type domain-containing protein n=1 Tax=Entamoeba invadens IP1 TaxID=370355 RepID=A0A0A1TYE4_ENTIV|nr:hypothetical protein EIN_033950 [Entamoeba invadens IP1]ELP86494.1 hypothetical protein EIN_033950 [Entamoeba invadens IP1]|eukprot:XP_004185840.1 hypothetical protein EIN_033950 [Entamoeba invadens IP1]